MEGIVGNSIYRAAQLGPGFWRIADGLVCFYLFEGRDRALLVDAGFSNGNVKEFALGLTSLPITLVCTHADPDHIGGAASFDAVYLHPAEFSRYAALLSESGGGGAPAMPLWEKDVIGLGGRSFEAVLIPGHTPGSLALLDRENRIIVTGDTVSSTPVFMFGEGRSVPAIIASLAKLETLAPAFDTVYPSHGDFPLGPDAVAAQRKAAELLSAGKLEAVEPIIDIPAKMYSHGPASFFF